LLLNIVDLLLSPTHIQYPPLKSLFLLILAACLDFFFHLKHWLSSLTGSSIIKCFQELLYDGMYRIYQPDEKSLF